ncbi:MAG: hypothetical protein V3T53_07285 [Phycisphaerales bacterium]
MTCFLNCLLRNALFIVFATVLGFAVGVIGTAFITCLIAEGFVHGATSGATIWLFGTVTLACMGAELLTPLPWIIGALAALAAFLLSTGIVVLGCAALCSATAGARILPGGLPTDLFGGEGIDCVSATAALAGIEDALAAARAERDAKQQALDNAIGRANTARAFMLAAIAALAVAPFWNLAAIAVAAAAVAVTSAAWLIRQSQVAMASIALAAAQAEVNALQGAVATAQAAKDAACGPSDVVPPVTDSPISPPDIDVGVGTG